MDGLYLFVDGAYLRERLEGLATRYLQGDRPDIDYRVMFRNLWPPEVGGPEKVLYFDCRPPQRKSEHEGEYNQRVALADQTFRTLRALPGCHVILGETKQQKQKGVDVHLAVQALMHVFRRNTRKLGLLAGDLDFKPLVDALVLEGAYVTLIYDPRTTARELIDAADAHRVLWPHDLLRYMTGAFLRRHLPPKVSQVGWAGDLSKENPAGLDQIKTWRCSLGTVALCQSRPATQMHTLYFPIPGMPYEYWIVEWNKGELMENLVNDLLSMVG